MQSHVPKSQNLTSKHRRIWLTKLMTHPYKDACCTRECNPRVHVFGVYIKGQCNTQENRRLP